MNVQIANDLIRYAELVEDGALISPEEMNCASLMRLAAEALAQPEQEPVAWEYKALYIPNPQFDDGMRVTRDLRVAQVNGEPDTIKPLGYTTPPQRTWVGLTGREKSNLWLESRAAIPRFHTYASLVEAKLKEKNT